MVNQQSTLNRKLERERERDGFLSICECYHRTIQNGQVTQDGGVSQFVMTPEVNTRASSTKQFDYLYTKLKQIHLFDKIPSDSFIHFLVVAVSSLYSVPPQIYT